jgi:hypothetical protein
MLHVGEVGLPGIMHVEANILDDIGDVEVVNVGIGGP